MSDNKSEQPTFEESIKRLEEIVAKLEEGQVPLDESLKLFEEGVGLSRQCNARLEEIERRIEILVKGEDGEFEARPFEEEMQPRDRE